MQQAPNQVVFHTNGIIDPLSWEVIGMSAKETDNAIGQFGSGLKFAIAVLLRNGHEIEIHTPDNSYIFSTKTQFFRGKEFQLVFCNDKQLSMTTDMGKHWELWMAYRELVCNTLDEGGLHYVGEKMDDGTSIIIRGDAFCELLGRHEDFFVGDREPISCIPNLMNIYEGKGVLYYRGVRIGTLEKANFSYEFLDSIQLTEDRTYANIYSVKSSISRALCRLTNSHLIRRLLNCELDSFEAELDYAYTWTNEFEACCWEQWKKCPSKMFKAILKQLRNKRPDITIECQPMTPSQRKMTDDAIAALAQCGYSLTNNIELTKNREASRCAYMVGTQICVTEDFFIEGKFNRLRVLLAIYMELQGPFSQIQTLISECMKHACARFKIEL